MLNGRLGQLYGIPGVEGLWEFRRRRCLPIAIAAAVDHGAAEGDCRRHQYFPGRGRWRWNDPGTPPPRPPADVPPLEPDVRADPPRTTGETSQQCRSLVRQDRSAGLPWRLDAIGGWREYYRLNDRWPEPPIKGKFYLQGPDVDATGETADGSRFQNIDESAIAREGQGPIALP